MVVIFGETTQMNILGNPIRQWYLNGAEIEEKTCWDHVGINLCGSLSSTERSKNVAKMGKSAMGMLKKAGVCPGAINPICDVGALKFFGISAMLYGSEIWWNSTTTEEELLNRVNVFSAKRFQGLCPTTHSIGALRSTGLWSIIGYID